MNIHEHQAKELLKKFGIPVPNGVVAFSTKEVLQKIKLIKTKKYVLKAQIHAGGRGKAGGIKILENLNDLEKESSNLLGKFLKTHQTGTKGKEVKRLYIEEATEIGKELYDKINDNGFFGPNEFLIRAQRKEYTIKEFPVKWSENYRRIGPWQILVTLLIPLTKLWINLTFRKNQ